MKNDDRSIRIIKNGPYQVSKGTPLYHETVEINDEGESIDWTDKLAVETPDSDYFLCRCGRSTNMPFCDGTHTKETFNSDEVARKEYFDDNIEITEGINYDLKDQKGICISIRHCLADGGIRNLLKDDTNPNADEMAKKQSFDCPSGRLILLDKEGNAIEPDFDQGISVIVDPFRDCYGPLWVKGGIQIISSDEELYEKRERATLCRCGESKNMPFCDAKHYEAEHMKGTKNDS